jgi:hypothetical protein
VLGRDGDFTRQLGKQLGTLFILPPLAEHDVFELGMTGHNRFRLANELMPAAI